MNGRTPGEHRRKTKGKTKGWFHHTSNHVADAMGTPWAFLTAVLIVTVWAVSGPIFDYSDTWQLVINTGTTVITFLMVFLVQATQNRDAKALHLKLDELVRCGGARNRFVGLEQAEDRELDGLRRDFARLRSPALAIAEVAETYAPSRTPMRSGEQDDVVLATAVRKLA